MAVQLMCERVVVEITHVVILLESKYLHGNMLTHPSNPTWQLWLCLLLSTHPIPRLLVDYAIQSCGVRIHFQT